MSSLNCRWIKNNVFFILNLSTNEQNAMVPRCLNWVEFTVLNPYWTQCWFLAINAGIATLKADVNSLTLCQLNCFWDFKLQIIVHTSIFTDYFLIILWLVHIFSFISIRLMLWTGLGEDSGLIVLWIQNLRDSLHIYNTPYMRG